MAMQVSFLPIVFFPFRSVFPSLFPFPFPSPLYVPFLPLFPISTPLPFHCAPSQIHNFLFLLSLFPATKSPSSTLPIS